MSDTEPKQEGNHIPTEQPALPPRAPTDESGASKDKKIKANQKMFLCGFVGLLVIGFAAASGVVFYRAYWGTRLDEFTLLGARALGLPAFKINGERVLYGEYAADMQAIKKMKDYEARRGAQVDGLTEQEMTKHVLLRLSNNILMEKAASNFGIKAGDEEVEELKAQLVGQFKTMAGVEEELRDRYGWTLDTYVKKVIRPFILQNKVAEKIQADVAGREAVRAKAAGVLEEIKKGADFAEMAKQHGGDGTAGNGGDLGWFGRGDMTPAFENAVFVLKKSEVSNLVETEYGYHIIKLEDTKKEAVKDAKGKITQEEKVSARHILFRFPDVNQYLREQQKQAEIHMYIHAPSPFAET